MKLSVFLKKFSAEMSDLVIYGNEAVCLKAVEQDGYALRYVDVKVFEIDIEIK